MDSQLDLLTISLNWVAFHVIECTAANIQAVGGKFLIASNSLNVPNCDVAKI